jgi:hypothetical protein
VNPLGDPHHGCSTSSSIVDGAVQSYDHEAAVTLVAITVTAAPICQISTGPSTEPPAEAHVPEIRAVPPGPTVIVLGDTLSGTGEGATVVLGGLVVVIAAVVVVVPAVVVVVAKVVVVVPAVVVVVVVVASRASVVEAAVAVDEGA